MSTARIPHAIGRADGARRLVRRRRSGTPTLITGGAGFIGSNLAHRLLSTGRPVLILDNLSRPGVVHNLEWLRATHGGAVEILVADVRDKAAVREAVARVRHVYHFAAQVAVTSSLADPCEDFAINALGTLNVLEALRAQASAALAGVHLDQQGLWRAGRRAADAPGPALSAGVGDPALARRVRGATARFPQSLRVLEG